MEAVCLHVVFNPLQGFIFSFNFSNNGPSVDFEFGVTLMMAAVALHFGEGGGVFKATSCFSQGVIGSSPGLEEFDEPLWQGGGGLL